jgi:YhcH/YjgK/YiaL family protein
MIIDKIENAKLYYGISERLEKGLRFLEETNLDALELGRHQIYGDEIFILVQEYETKNIEDASYEAHRKYIDIQYITKGIERMDYCPLNELNLVKEYDEAKDIIRLEGKGSPIFAGEKSFCIFFPNDGHMPGLKVEEKSKVRKIVVKVLV